MRASLARHRWSATDSSIALKSLRNGLASSTDHRRLRVSFSSSRRSLAGVAVRWGSLRILSYHLIHRRNAHEAMWCPPLLPRLANDHRFRLCYGPPGTRNTLPTSTHRVPNERLGKLSGPFVSPLAAVGKARSRRSSNQLDVVEVSIQLLARTIRQDNAERAPVVARSKGPHQMMILQVS